METPLFICLENDSPSRGRKREHEITIIRSTERLENDSPSRGRKRNSLNTSEKIGSGV